MRGPPDTLEGGLTVQDMTTEATMMRPILFKIRNCHDIPGKVLFSSFQTSLLDQIIVHQSFASDTSKLAHFLISQSKIIALFVSSWKSHSASADIVSQISYILNLKKNVGLHSQMDMSPGRGQVVSFIITWATCIMSDPLGQKPPTMELLQDVMIDFELSFKLTHTRIFFL